MTMTTAQLETLARKLLRAELSARNCTDVDATETVLAPRLRFDPETLEHVSLDLISNRSGHPNASLDEVLAAEMKARPEAFGGQAQPPGRVGQPPAGNPFRSDATAHGPNLTEIMLAYRKDPEEAEQMARDASFWSKIR